jgi:hypothetical protein
MQKFFPATKKDAHLLLSTNIQVNFKVVLEFSNLLSKNKHPPNAFNYQQTSARAGTMLSALVLV